MKPGELFELEALDYLKKNYTLPGIVYDHTDTADSTRSDIEVIKNGQSAFFIEAKDTTAQSGQFVLLPDDIHQRFIFSPKNKSIPNEMTDIIINYMNSDYSRFNNAGTAGENLEISSDIFTKWIVGHYREKGVKFVISKKANMVICPIEKFGEYFDVSASFRIKKSGSSAPSANNISAVKSELIRLFNCSSTIQKGKKLYVEAPSSLSKARFDLGNYTYYLSPQEDQGIFEVKQLSNTRNKNVIFSINIKQDQNPDDLSVFLRALS